MKDQLAKLVARLKEHKILVAVAIGVAAAADHFIGSGVISATLSDLLASAPDVVAP